MKRITHFACLTGAFLSLSFVACNPTPGASAEATLQLAPSLRSFTTSTGWSVTLTEAVLVPDALYVYAPSGDTMASLQELMWPVAMPVAHAHGGHDPFGSRRVRLEWLGPQSLDLLGDTTIDIGLMDGTVGSTSDVTLAFAALTGDLASTSGASHAHHAWVRGTATKMGETIGFAGGLDFGSGGTEGIIESIMVSPSITRTGTQTLLVNTAAWLDLCQFDRLPGTGTDERVIEPLNQVGVGFGLGLRNATSYSLAYVPNAEMNP